MNAAFPTYPSHPPVRRGFHNHQWRKTEMIRSLLAVAVVAIGVGTLAAQTDPIATRKALMKANGDQARIASEMSRGNGRSIWTLQKKRSPLSRRLAKKRPRCFPTAPKPEATPRPCLRSGKTRQISRPNLQSWRVSRKQRQRQRRDFESFKAQFSELGKNCGGCHQTYRKRAT